MRVERDDGRILLARNPHFPMPFFSLLAGFVEPGETLEQAVVRETYEEVGLTVGDLRYWGSQPWPFPHSLMVGFVARYLGGELVLQEDEIAEAGWFEPDELPTTPPAMSIAGRMIEAWASGAGERPAVEPGALQVPVAFEPAHGEPAPRRRQVERRHAVGERGREGDLLRETQLHEPERQRSLGDADAAGHGHDA